VILYGIVPMGCYMRVEALSAPCRDSQELLAELVVL